MSDDDAASESSEYDNTDSESEYAGSSSVSSDSDESDGDYDDYDGAVRRHSATHSPPGCFLKRHCVLCYSMQRWWPDLPSLDPCNGPLPRCVQRQMSRPASLRLACTAGPKRSTDAPSIPVATLQIAGPMSFNTKPRCTRA